MVTNPATRDWTVTASIFATLNEMYGNRTVCGIGRGDSAVRVTNGKPTTLADAARVDPRDPRARATGATVEYQGIDAAVPVERRGRALEVWVAAYGPKALEADRRGRRRLHPAAGRPRHRRVDDHGGARGRGGGRPRPRRGHDLRRRARVRRRRPWRAHARPVPLVRRHGRQPRRRHRRPVRRPTARVPAGADRLHRGPRRATTTTSTAGPGNTHTDFVPDEIVDRFCILGPAERAHRAARASCAALGVDQFAVYLQHDGKAQTLRGLRRDGHPGGPEHVTARA